ncbi:MAG: Fic family protein [Alphaproteobacteria bacterium]|nr:Fic family protein [Alphaproteobacteria bacterium]
MAWNWEQGDWPHFRWDAGALAVAEAKFLRQSGVLVGATKHFSEEDKNLLVIDLMTGEAVKTSEIEGEVLNRDSVQSSIRRHFGLDTDNRRIEPAERGIADMMTDLYKNFNKPLSHAMLARWHKMLASGRHDLKDIGRYRTHQDPMQIVSGRLDKPMVHFEAPPSKRMKKEMDAFMAWWRDTAPAGKASLPALTRAGIAHLYFVCIHPFEDGNGRIGRALVEKSFAEYQGESTLIALSQTIERSRKAYYDALEANNKANEITDWLVYFADMVLEAQSYSLDMVDFLIEKTKLYDRVRGSLNERQEKVLAHMFREGLGGFKGGLSAENYISITGTSRATATRDLQDLVEKDVLLKTGELKSTRYQLNVALRGQEYSGR